MIWVVLPRRWLGYHRLSVCFFVLSRKKTTFQVADDKMYPEVLKFESVSLKSHHRGLTQHDTQLSEARRLCQLAEASSVNYNVGLL